MEITSIFTQFAALSGVSALIAAVINILKTLSIVKDGEAQIYSLLLNFLALAGLIGLNLFSPQTDIAALDIQAEKLAELLLIVFAYTTQLGISKLSHKIFKSAPFIGKSYTAAE